MALVKLKRGDTFAFTSTFTDGAGLPLTGIANKLRSQIRNVDDILIKELDITETEVDGTYLFQVLDTKDFPIEQLKFDIQYTGFDGVIDSTPTYIIKVEEDITHD